MTPKKTIAGLSATAILMGGVDASILNEKPLERLEMVANERVEAKQLGNIVETTFPWKDQPGIKVKVNLGEPSLTERIKDKRKKEVITEVVDFGDGGFKVDILLNEKPNTNRFCYAIEGAENYDFFYQPPLTAEEIAEGSYRAPEIEGSYAVYHKTLKNHIVGRENYATGKVMHIPRPQVWELNDKDNTTVWADLSYDNGQLCVTVDQEYLNKAKYPVRVDPTFGYTSLGGTDQSGGYAWRLNGTTVQRSVLRGEVATTTETGTLDSISIGMRGSAAHTVDIYAALYLRDDPSSGNHTKVAGIERTGVSVGTTAAFYDFTASGESLAVDEYIIAGMADWADLSASGDRRVHARYDTTSNHNFYSENRDGAGSYTAAKAEDPWTVFNSVQNTLFSNYATYTATGGGGSSPSQLPIFFQ